VKLPHRVLLLFPFSAVADHVVHRWVI